MLSSAPAAADLTPSFIIAISAFATAILVAAIIAPLGQARTRRTERWEKAVSDMSALADVKLDQAIRQYSSSAAFERELRQIEASDDPDINRPMLKDLLERTTAEQRAARELLSDHVADLLALRNTVRLRLVDLDRRRLDALVRGACLNSTLLQSTSIRLDRLVGEDMDALGREVTERARDANAAREALVSFVEPLALTLRPPRLRALVARRVGRSLMWLRRPFRRVHAWAMRQLSDAD